MTKSGTGPVVHAICGGVGAGKSTLAMRLKEDHRAMLFAGDQWMARLFFPDMPEPPEFDWVWERIGRAEEQIWEQVQQAAALGIASILDLGLTTFEHRNKFLCLAREAGLDFRLHWIDLPAELRWQRVQKRNEQRGSTFAIPVSRENFRSEEHTSELQSRSDLVCRLLLEKKNATKSMTSRRTSPRKRDTSRATAT